MGDRHMQNAIKQIQERSSKSYPVATESIPARRVPNVSHPVTTKPTDEQFYLRGTHGDRRPNPAFLKEHFFREGRLTEAQAIYILESSTGLLSREANMVTVSSPVTICGDVHGQYYDLMKLLEVGGSTDTSTYVFLGDYVDRGCFGIECLLYLYALKLVYPDKVILLRGNHECRHLTEYFTFKRECLHKYSEAVYEACIRSFCALPLAALVDGRFFCVHGGISPELVHLSDLARIHRFEEPGSHGLLCDLLWSDPIPNFGHEQDPGPRALTAGTQFLDNHTRGCSFFFTYEAVCQFLDRNNLLSVIRGHEAQNDGFTMYRRTTRKNFPALITIFSAPNYLDVYHNRAAVLKYANKNITIRQYNATPHPYWLPNFMDAFTWSLPFVGAKITEMLLAVLSVCSQEELNDTDSASEDGAGAGAGSGTKNNAELEARRQIIRKKILAVGTMQRIFQRLREEAETASELETAEAGAAPGANETLGVQGAYVRRSIRTFDDARQSDIRNERLPTFATSSSTIIPAPSMRVASRRGSGDPGTLNRDHPIRQTLAEDKDEAGVVEQLADRMARSRKPTGRLS